MRIWKHRADGDDLDETKIFTMEKNTNDTAPSGNKIYFFTDISKETILNLSKQIDDVSKQMKIAQYTYGFAAPPPIELHICSDGGDVFPSVGLVDKIINSEVPIWTYSEGIVASAATLISCAGHKRFITQRSCMLIHQVSSGLWGNYQEFKDEIQNLDLIMSLIKGVYIKKTKLDSKTLDELLSHDLIWSADECLKHGLVDVIL